MLFFCLKYLSPTGSFLCLFVLVVALVVALDMSALTRLDVYQASAAAQHPLAAIELTNNSDTGLPPGVLTLYQPNAERGALYLGDARLAAFPVGDKRLLSYAVDSKLLVDRSTAEQRPIVKATIVLRAPPIPGMSRNAQRKPIPTIMPGTARG